MKPLRALLAWLQRLSGQFLYEALIRTLRSSFLIGGAAVLLSSTGTWKYLVSSFAAHDFVQASQLPAGTAVPKVATVLIDDKGYRDYFGERSPLDRARLLKLLQTIDAAVPRARAIVIDLDLAPLPGHSQKALLDWFARDPGRWVLAAPDVTANPQGPGRAAWRQALCREGVRIGWPYLPSDFGYASTMFQFAGSLSQVAADPAFGCARLAATLAGAQGGPGALRRVAAPMQPQFVRNGLVLPFDGDLGELESLLSATSPRWVVLGGSWGKSDLLDTPLGKRYGAQLHAAALAGRLGDQRMAPLLVQILVAWLFLACVDMLLGLLYRGVERMLLPWSDAYAGHRFLAQRIWPLTLVVVVMAGVLLASQASALLRVRTGYWIPSATIAAVSFINVLFVWNWGLNKLVRHDSLASAWRQVFVAPIRSDWKALLHAAALLRGHLLRVPAQGALGVPRAVVELIAALASLLIQTGFPMLVLASALR